MLCFVFTRRAARTRLSRRSTPATLATSLAAFVLAAHPAGAALPLPIPVTAPASPAPTATPALRPFGAPPAIGSARDITTLTISDRQTLPDQTPVTLQNKPSTLGQLRRLHDALVLSRSRAAALGKASLIGGSVVVPFHPVNPVGTIAAPLPLVKPATSAPYPNDYLAYCQAAAATVCLYYPAGTAWLGDTSSGWVTIDALMLDPSTCAGTGGTAIAGQGCEYVYPGTSLVNFVPPTGGFTTSSSGQCSQTMNGAYLFVLKTDQHGAVQIADSEASNLSPTATAPPACSAQVFLAP